MENNEQLTAFAEAAKTRRLAPGEEDQAGSLVRDLIISGKTGASEALEAAAALPWIVGVRGVEQAWETLSPVARRALLGVINKLEGDAGHRLRLSLARCLFKQDPAAGRKVAAAICEEIVAAGFAPRDRQQVASVFIGRNKPWIGLMTLDDLKPEESAAIVQSALAGALTRACPPPAQVSTLRWAVSTGQAAELPDLIREELLAAVKRWKPDLRREAAKIEGIPAWLAESLQGPPADAQAPRRPQRQPAARAPEESRPTAEPPPRSRPDPRGQSERREGDEGFNLSSALRQIESHVNSLREELKRARTEPRGRESFSRQSRWRKDQDQPAAEPAAPAEIEVLRRHNERLDETVAELRAQLEDLASHHEDQSLALPSAGGGEPDIQRLLGVKLSRPWTRFQALEHGTSGEVFSEHYRNLLEEVFRIMKQAGVALAIEPLQEDEHGTITASAARAVVNAAPEVSEKPRPAQRGRRRRKSEEAADESVPETESEVDPTVET